MNLLVHYAYGNRKRIPRTQQRKAARGTMGICLLPSVSAGYLPTVDLDAALAALAPRLVAYATGRTGCRSTGEDVAQDALAALVVRWTRHGPPESPEAF